MGSNQFIYRVKHSIRQSCATPTDRNPARRAAVYADIHVVLLAIAHPPAPSDAVCDELARVGCRLRPMPMVNDGACQRVELGFTRTCCDDAFDLPPGNCTVCCGAMRCSLDPVPALVVSFTFHARLFPRAADDPPNLDKTCTCKQIQSSPASKYVTFVPSNAKCPCCTRS